MLSELQAFNLFILAKKRLEQFFGPISFEYHLLFKGNN